MSFGTAKKASFPTTSRVVSEAPAIIVSPRRESVKGSTNDDATARATSSMGLRTKSALGDTITITPTSPTPTSTTPTSARAISRMALKSSTPVVEKGKKEEKPKDEKAPKSPTNKKSSTSSPSIKNKQTITRWYSLWNNFTSYESLLSYVDHAYIDHSNDTGYQQFQTYVKEIMNHKITWDVIQMIAEGDHVAVHCTLKGASTPVWSEFFRLSDARIVERWGIPYTTLISVVEKKIENNDATATNEAVVETPTPQA